MANTGLQKALSTGDLKVIKKKLSKLTNKTHDAAKIVLNPKNTTSPVGQSYLFQSPKEREFRRLLKEDSSKALSFATDCIEQYDEESQSLVKIAFPLLLEKNNVNLGWSFAARCLERAYSHETVGAGCLFVVENAFPQLLEKAGPTAAIHFARMCIESKASSCQRVIKQAFSLLLEKDPDRAFLFALCCLGVDDEACQSVVKKAFDPLLKDMGTGRVLLKEMFLRIMTDDRMLASNVAKRCVGKEDPLCQFVAEKAFSLLLKDDNAGPAFWFALSCVGKKDQLSQSVVKEAVPKLLAKHMKFGENIGYAMAIAAACIEFKDEVCQSVVKKSFFELLENDLKNGAENAYTFAKICLGKEDEGCQFVVKEAFLKLLERDPSMAREFAELCIGKTDEASQFVVRSAFSELLRKDESQALLFAKTCSGKNDPACRSVAVQKMRYDNPSLFG